MDQTKLFIARVKTFKLQLKAQQRESGSLDSPLRLKPSRRLTPFAAEAKDVVRTTDVLSLLYMYTCTCYICI